MLQGYRLATVVLVSAAALAVAAPADAQARAPFAIGGVEVAAGQRMDLDLPVPAGATDADTRVPVTVFHGAADGPVLALTAGVHGFEFVPILAGQRLLTRIDPARLRGTVVLVRLAHVEAFEQRAVYVNPADRKNLNRVFPGRPDGTQSERVAWAITSEVIRRCDLHVELHGGDGAEWMEPFAGPYGGPLAASQYERARAMALAFGLRNVITYEMTTQAQVDRNRSLNRQAVADGKPTVLVEIGENGRRDDSDVDALTRGLENLLRTLKMTDGAATPPRADTRWFGDSAEAVATTTGIFTPVATRGRPVGKGDLIGTVTDYAGREIERIVSPVDGYVMYGLAGPPVKAGEAVVTIGIPVP
ncbi:MAG: succinylglutamate desuccinylase/aspartoacylase family protein [Vicinamibacterales bacterium]